MNFPNQFPVPPYKFPCLLLSFQYQEIPKCSGTGSENKIACFGQSLCTRLMITPDECHSHNWFLKLTFRPSMPINYVIHGRTEFLGRIGT